jgi:NAD(P)-dependent dehydrogenase (short-subunit alcohol dehydrogenase family)
MSHDEGSAMSARRSIHDLMRLDGRVALVTGGAGHVGYAAAEALAELGARLVLLDIDAAAVQIKSDAIGSTFDTETLPLAIDLADPEAIASVPGKVGAAFGRLDILVNGAGLAGMSQMQGWVVPFLQQGLEAWSKALDVNLTAPFLLTQACAGLLASHARGSVVNLASIYGLLGPDMRLYEGTTMGNPAAYAASKGGLLQLTRYMATVLAPDIRVNTITPGGVWRDQPDSFVRRYVERTPLGRMATEEDIKGAIAYLTSDMSAYMTGQNLVIDGGWTAW